MSGNVGRFGMMFFGAETFGAEVICPQKAVFREPLLPSPSHHPHQAWGGATAKVDGAAPSVEPELPALFGRFQPTNLAEDPNN